MSSHTAPQEQYHQQATAFDLDHSLDHIAHWLPTQGPIKDFIHHNTLHAFQHLTFHEALSAAGKLFGARSYLPLDDYQDLYRVGRIKSHALDWALKQTGCSHSEQQKIRATLFDRDTHSHFPPVSLANHGIRNAWLTGLEIDLNALVHPIIFRLLGSFLDQGISRWTMAKNGERFWDCILRLTHNSLLPLYPLHEPTVFKMLSLSPDEIILCCLQKIVGSETLYEQYLIEMLLGHPGWSGMVRIIETSPQSLLARRLISLKELLALELLCELAIVNMRKPHGFLAIDELPSLQGVPKLHEGALLPTVPLRLRVWHDAMEWSLHSELLAALKNQAAVFVSKPKLDKQVPEIQAFFCIDDRECSLRRYIEAENPVIETFGAAGFFGIDFLYQGLDDAYPVAQCPVVITPKHLVREASLQERAEKKSQGIEFGKMHFPPIPCFEVGYIRKLWGWVMLLEWLGMCFDLPLSYLALKP